MKLFRQLPHEIYETCAFVLRLVADVCLRTRKPTALVRRIAIVSREDLFPTNHGAAVKIVQTARHVSLHYDEVIVVTQSRSVYHVFRNGERTEHIYPVLARWAFWIPFRYLWRRIFSTGFTREEWLARPYSDMNFKFRVMYLAVRRPFDVMQAEFSPFVYACDWASKVYPDLPRITVEHNVEFLRIGATYNLPPPEVQKMKEFEIKACQSSDRVVAVSDPDRDILIEHGVEASRMAVIPLGVDLSEYKNRDIGMADAVRRRYGILNEDYVIMFHGVLSYRPNRDAVRLLATEIMPCLRSGGCPVKLLVVGANPPAELAAEDIIMTGPAEFLPPFIHAADVAVVPLLDGGGTRLKILEYFAAGIPVISTAKGAEGIKAEHGKDLVIEDSMDGIARLIAELRVDAVRRRSIGENGRRFVQNFGWDRVAADYCELYAEVVKPKFSADCVKADCGMTG